MKWAWSHACALLPPSAFPSSAYFGKKSCVHGHLADHSAVGLEDANLDLNPPQRSGKRRPGDRVPGSVHNSGVVDVKAVDALPRSNFVGHAGGRAL